jgi:hypothetical protein
MKKWQTSNEIYRLPPDKKNPKGIRVRKAIGIDTGQSNLKAVIRIKDGYMMYTRRELTPEKKGQK